MFSFSLRWLWAQCLLVSAGFFLLGQMAVPGPESRLPITGTVKDVATISRKGLGSFYELTLQTEGRARERVLFARDVAGENAVRSLIGLRISAHVNLSSEAIDLKVHGVSTFDASAVRHSAENGKTQYKFLALLFAGGGLALGLITFAFRRNRMA